VNEDSGSDSDSSSLEEDDPGCLDAFEEITEQSDLDAFSTILKAAQKVALTAERKKRAPYTGHSRATQYRRQKIRVDLASKGFLPIGEFMAWAEAKRRRARSTQEESEESPGESSAAQSVGRISNHAAIDAEGSLSSGVANSCVLIHALREEEEEEEEEEEIANENANAIRHTNANKNTNADTIENATVSANANEGGFRVLREEEEEEEEEEGEDPNKNQIVNENQISNENETETEFPNETENVSPALGNGFGNARWTGVS